MRITRRRLLVSAGAAAVAAGIFPVAFLEAANERVFFLDPEWGAGQSNCGPCSACKACHGNALKMFTSAALAEHSRAHPYCKCLLRSKSVPEREFVSLFGPNGGPRHRDEYDPRRDKLFLPSPPGLEKKGTPTPTPAPARGNSGR